MAQRTIVLRRFQRASGHVGIDGTRLFVLHPDAPTQIVEMPHRTEAEAEATLKKVLREYFNSRHGWEVFVDTKHLDTSTWIEPEPAPPTEAQLEAGRARERGWLVDGDMMVLSLSRNCRPSDLAMALERAADVTALRVLVSQDDCMGDEDEPTARYGLFKHLVDGAVPKLSTLTLESPWAPQPLEPLSLDGLEEVLQKFPLAFLGALGAFAWPDKASRALAHVRLQNPSLSPAAIKHIGKLPALRVLQLRLPKDDAPHRKAIAGLPLARLEELVVEYVNVDKLMTTLLDAGTHGLPKRVHLSGLPGRGITAAVAKWRDCASGSELTFSTDMASYVSALDVVLRDSPFDADAAIYAPFG